MKAAIPWTVLLAGLLAVSLAAGCARPAPTPSVAPAPGEVVIEDFAFRPLRLTIKASESVTWTNRDSDFHTVTGDSWDSGNLGPGESYTRKFDVPGTYEYRCVIHPFMSKGTVVVQ